MSDRERAVERFKMQEEVEWLQLCIADHNRKIEELLGHKKTMYRRIREIEANLRKESNERQNEQEQG